MSKDIGMSPIRRGLLRLKDNRIACLSLWVLAVLYVCALFADFLAPYHFDNERRELSYHPPSVIRIIDEEGSLCMPFVYSSESSFNKYRRRSYKENKTDRFGVKFFVQGDSYKLFGIIPSNIHLFGVEKDARVFLLGADSRGRDLFSRLLYGSRISLTVGLLGVMISFSIGMLVGGIAGYFGGRIDNIIMRVCEMFMMIPGFYLLLALRMRFPYEMSSTQVYIMIVLIMSFIGWAGLARVIRGMTISLRSREFIGASITSGRKPLATIFVHLLPNTASYAIVAATLSVPGYILGEAALSLLGLGIQDPNASWGNLLSDAMGIAQIRFHPWMLMPGVFIFIAVMAYNFLGDGLRDALDPHQEIVRY